MALLVFLAAAAVTGVVSSELATNRSVRRRQAEAACHLDVRGLHRRQLAAELVDRVLELDEELIRAEPTALDLVVIEELAQDREGGGIAVVGEVRAAHVGITADGLEQEVEDPLIANA